MTIVIICGVLGWIVAKFDEKKMGLRKFDSLEVAIPAAGMVLGFVIATAILATLPLQKNVEYQRNELLSLANHSDLSGKINGNVFLISGQIGSKEYHRFYRMLPDGGAQIQQLEADNNIVYEEKRENGYVIYRGNVSTRPKWLIKWLYAGLIDKRMIYHEYCEFHVPNGTIQKGFKLE